MICHCIADIKARVPRIETPAFLGYVSVEDFYKVYGYACLYAALYKVKITDVTITFIESRYPRELIKHLEEVRGYRVEEKWDGIYIVSGDIMPIQIINSKALSAGDNMWLRDLSNELDIASIKKVIAEIDQQGIAPQLGAYIYAVYQANQFGIQEALQMSDVALTLDKIFEDAGLTAKWEAKGSEKKALKIAKTLLQKGWSVEETAETAELDIAAVQSLRASI
jgi:hypothetical protein